MDQANKKIEVTRTYLQLNSRDEFSPSRLNDARVRVERAVNCPASFFAYLYREVGRHYHWTDRLIWSDEQSRGRLADRNVSLWVMYVEGSPAGYFELERHADGATEIAYFGLLPEFIGGGLGKHLLTTAVEQAWADGANRVWLHTCTLDNAAALPNYIKRGFKPFKEERYSTDVSPDEMLRSC